MKKVDTSSHSISTQYSCDGSQHGPPGTYMSKSWVNESLANEIRLSGVVKETVYYTVQTVINEHDKTLYT